MQQTDKYKLNLIETSDTFSPAPLNENMEKVEGALETVRAEAAAGDAALSAADAALDQRVQVLEARKIVVGYAPEAGTVHLGFTPTAVIAQGFGGNSFTCVSLADSVNGVRIVTGGFTHDSYLARCNYVAFL